MKKQVIILDFDGVVVNTEHLQLEYLNKKYGMNSKKEDYDHSLYLHENVNKLIGLDLSFEDKSFIYAIKENAWNEEYPFDKKRKP